MHRENEDILNQYTLSAELSRNKLGIGCQVVECLSTQKYSSGISVAQDTVIVALEQKGGIGRLDRRFISAIGGCYFSLIAKKNKNFANLQYIPMISVAIATIIGEYGVSVQIKWPNDILVNGRKICGILCSSHNDKVIIGVGINVYNDLSEIADIATSLALEGVSGVNRASLITKVLAKFYEFTQEDFETIRLRYNNYLNILDKTVTVYQLKDRIEGKVIGIDKNGFLLIQDKHCLNTVCHGDIVVN